MNSQQAFLDSKRDPNTYRSAAWTTVQQHHPVGGVRLCRGILGLLHSSPNGFAGVRLFESVRRDHKPAF